MGLGHRCAGPIGPSRFVKRGATEGTVLQCGAGDVAWGVSQAGTRNAPFAGLDDGLAGDIGDAISVTTLEPNKRVPWVCAGGVIAVGVELAPDADGKAIDAALVVATHHVAARAEQAGTANQLVMCVPVDGHQVITV